MRRLTVPFAFAFFGLLLAGNTFAAAQAARTVSCRQGDYDCFITAAQKCTRAKMTTTSTVNLLGIEQTSTSLLEIRGKSKGRCSLYRKHLKTNLRSDPVAGGDGASITAEALERARALAKTTEGLDGICSFKTNDLIALIRRWRAGEFSSNDYARATCTGKLHTDESSSGPSTSQPATPVTTIPPSAGATPKTRTEILDEIYKRGCALTVASLKKACKLPNTLPIKDVFIGLGCDFYLSDSMYWSSKGPNVLTHKIQIGGSKESIEYNDVRPAKGRVEEVTELGEYSVLVYDEDKKTCGKPDPSFALHTVSNGRAHTLRSAATVGAIEGGKGSACTFRSAKGGCDTEEVKRIMRDIVIPHFSK